MPSVEGYDDEQPPLEYSGPGEYTEEDHKRWEELQREVENIRAEERQRAKDRRWRE